MAKDGTNRGGNRTGSGRKAKPLIEKIVEGKLKPTKLEAIEFEGSDMPPIKDYLKAKQKNGKDLVAEEVYKETWLWLKEKGCERLVSAQLLEQYAMSVSRWIQCQEAVSEFGFLAKHPTTGAAMTSPYVKMSQDFLKQANLIWYQIFQVVKDNSLSGYGGSNPQDDLMERILNRRK